MYHIYKCRETEVLNREKTDPGPPLAAGPERKSLGPGCRALQTLNLDLHECLRLANVDALQSLDEIGAHIQTVKLGLSGCTQLANVDGYVCSNSALERIILISNCF